MGYRELLAWCGAIYPFGIRTTLSSRFVIYNTARSFWRKHYDALGSRKFISDFESTVQAHRAVLRPNGSLWGVSA